MSETYWTSVEYKSQIKEQRIWPFEVSSEIEMCLGYCSLLEAKVMLALYMVIRFYKSDVIGCICLMMNVLIT